MAYQSGEFRIPGAQLCGAATVFNNTLFVLNQFGPDGQFITTFDLTKLKKRGSTTDDEPINGEALTNPANWVASASTLPMSGTKMGLVSFAGAMYCFLNSIQNFTARLLASRYSLSDDTTVPGTWSQPVSLLESDGKTVPIADELAGVSATTVGDNIIILACGYASSSSNSAGGTYVAIYDTRDLDTDGNKWAAKWHDYLPSQPPDYSTQDYINVSIEWFSQIDPDAQKSDPPAYFVGVFVQPHLWTRTVPPYHPAKMSFYRMTLGEQAGSEVSVTLAKLNSLDGPSVFFANVIRDPAGRLRSWVSQNDLRNFQAVLLDVTVGEHGGGFGFNPSSESISVTDNVATKHFPFSLFFVFSDGQSDTTVNGESATQYPVYEFVFYGGAGECQVNRCGTIQTIADFSVRKTKRDLNIPLNVISGIIDGPIPVPLENFQDYNTGPGQASAGSMIYGIEDSKNSSHTVTNTWSLGFESQGKMTTGVGPAWDISFKGGTGSQAGDSSGTTTSYDLAVDSIITTAPGNYNPTIVKDGVLRGVGIQFSLTAFRYLDNFGPNVDSTDNSDTNGLKTAMVTQSMVDESLLNFEPYMVTPGQLESYTPEAINAAMKAKGYTATDNYFGDVIMTNAYPFNDPTNPYIGYSWSADGTIGEAFSKWAESFQESSWHLDLHAYGGVSGGSGASVFGEGAVLQWDIMAGVDYSHNSISDADKKSGWSIGLSKKWGPPYWEKRPKSVSAYDFRIYFLPVPVAPSKLTKTYWTTELITQTKLEGVDGNSGSWRIVYVVTRIEHMDGSNPYHYNGKLDVKRSIYKLGDE